MSATEESASDQNVRRIKRALSNRNEVPRIYANNFALAVGPADITIALEFGDEPVAVLTFSHTAAKTLAGHILKLIGTVERATNVPTYDEMQELLQKSIGAVENE